MKTEFYGPDGDKNRPDVENTGAGNITWSDAKYVIVVKWAFTTDLDVVMFDTLADANAFYNKSVRPHTPRVLYKSWGTFVSGEENGD